MRQKIAQQRLKSQQKQYGASANGSEETLKQLANRSGATQINFHKMDNDKTRQKSIDDEIIGISQKRLGTAAHEISDSRQNQTNQFIYSNNPREQSGSNTLNSYIRNRA